jgi:hypothetical protein
MKMFKVLTSSAKFMLLAGSLSALSFAAQAADPAKDPVVKKSEAGICHDVSSSSFGNTKKFTPFNSLEECVKSGGKLPAGKTQPVAEVVKKSESGICHDKSSSHYEQTKKFTEFKSLDECLKNGGKLPKK